MSDGIVSANRDFSDAGRILQITAPISPGSSGSPVLDATGRVIGVATLTLLDGQSLNFAVAVEHVSELRSRIKSDQKPVRWVASTSPSTSAAPSISAQKRSETLPQNDLSDLVLELSANKNGLLAFNVHNGTKWRISAIIVNMRRWYSHSMFGDHSGEQTRKFALRPKGDSDVAPFSDGAFVVNVGKFLDNYVWNYDGGSEIVPCWQNVTIVEAEGYSE